MKLRSLKDTHNLANLLVAELPANSLLILKGDLGAGKTTLVQFLATELNSRASVSSPSYTLIHEYPTAEGLLVHIDAYRLATTEELFELGLEDYLERARLTVVEWGEGLLEFFPEAKLVEIIFDGKTRVVKIQ